MKRFLVLALGLFFMSGCLMRTYVADQNGSNGYQLNQTSNEGRVFKFGKAKKIAVMEVETGNHELKVIGSQPAAPEAVEETTSTEYTTTSTDSGSAESYTCPTTPAGASEGKDVSYTEYTIQKNDTLQKVSQKFYGTTKKWMKIYNDNKDVLSSPDKIYPGLVIKVMNKD